MRRILLAIIVGAAALGGMSLAHHDDHGKDGDYVKVLSQREITEKVDGKKAKASTVEVTLALWAGGGGAPSSRPGVRLRPGGRVRVGHRR